MCERQVYFASQPWLSQLNAPIVQPVMEEREKREQREETNGDGSDGLRVPVPRAVPVPRFAMRSMHELGRCTPCRFFAFKDDGCHKGDACEFCHLCSGPDALKRSKRAHVARKKQEDAVQRKLTKNLSTQPVLRFWL